MEIKHPHYFGQLLVRKGFRAWFKYMFYAIERSKFIEEGLHPELFKVFGELHDLKHNRVNINIPPRSGKTTMAKYFLAYCWARNPRCNFIYTSFSQSLLGDISRSLIDVFEHPIYKSMYSQNIHVEDVEDSPVDDFWRSYLNKDQGRGGNQYSIKKIVSPFGGVILFASIGSAITGFGAGVRAEGEKFSGALIMDDPNKPADIQSELMRKKVVTYYEGTLLSRLNSPITPIVNIQQRLDVEDLAATLIEKYNFYTLAVPLIGGDGICALPSQYTKERIKEIKINSSVFLSQYQQQPAPTTGGMFKIDWFKRYVSVPIGGRVVQSWDTAVKDNQLNDFSVCTTWLISESKYYLIDALVEKLKYPELKKQVIYQSKLHNPDTILIEDKASGQSLIQDLRSQTTLPIIAITPKHSKVVRASTVTALIESGNVVIPDQADWLFEFEKEIKLFPNGSHDDIVDSMTQFLNWVRLKPVKPKIRQL